MAKILMTTEGKKFLVKDTTKDFHTQFGYIQKKDLRKKGKVTSNTGKDIFLFDAGFMDIYQKISRAPQIMSLKEIGSIIVETGINKDSKVVDAGVGSGALACLLAHLVKSVASYDIREDFINVAKKNAQTLGLKNLKIKKGNVYHGISEKNVDLITLDLPEPWKSLPTAEASLKQGGYLVSYSPTIVQTADFVNAVLDHTSFVHLKTIEIIQREWEIQDRKVRPKTKVINHTGFLSFVRKLI